MSYLMEINDNDDAVFLKTGHKKKKILNKKKYKRLRKMKKNSKHINRNN